MNAGKKEIRGEELTVKLYKDLLINYEDSKNAYQAIDRQIRYIDLVLTQGKNLNIDSLLSVTEEEYRFAKVFTFPVYILYFTEYYTPNLQVFESSRNDGSIKLVQDEDLVNAQEFIHIDASSRMKILDDREIASNENIEEYIAANYSRLFEDHTTYKEGQWDRETTKKLLNALLTDGALRYKLHQKNNKLKSKRAHLQHRIIPTIASVLATHVRFE